MENRIYQTEEHNVGDDPLASLRPPVGWNPDSDQAWKRLVERGEAGSSTSKARLTVIGIALIAAGSILFFLPWHRVWSPDSKRAEPVVTESQTGPVYTEGVVPTPVVKIQVIPDSQPLSPALPGGGVPELLRIFSDLVACFRWECRPVSAAE